MEIYEPPLGAEYPKHLYRDGGDVLIDGKPVETVLAQDADEEEVLLLEGWRLSPLATDSDVPRKGRPPKLQEAA